jgi:hypothetical protein
MSHNATIKSVKQIGPTSFSVQLVSAGKYLIVLSTAFDENWRATSAGADLNDHVLANGYSNGWMVNGSGEATIEITYRPQPAYNASVVISLLVIIVVLAALAAPRLVRLIRERSMRGKMQRESFEMRVILTILFFCREVRMS